MNNTDTPDSYNHLVAENESLKGRLEEYQHMIVIKEKEILELRLQIAGDNEIKSNLDNKAVELELLQNYIVEIDQQTNQPAIGEMYLKVPVSGSINVKHQWQDLKQQCTYLQTQLSDLQKQLLDLNNRNLLLQQQTNRIAELESFLADAEQERDEWKELAKLKK